MLISSYFLLNTSHLQQSDVRAAHLAEHGSYDAGPVAVQQALLIDRVMTNQVFHHQQEGSDAISLQSAL